MPRYSQIERDEIRAITRQKLIQAAIQAFAHQGFHQAKIDAISQAAGFSKGTVYNYFDSKHALMLALIDEIANIHFEYIASQVLVAQSPQGRLERFFVAGFDFVRVHLSMAKVMVNNLYGSQTDFKEAMFAAYQPLFRLVRSNILAYGIEENAFRPVDPIAMGGLLMNVYLGTASQVDDEGNPWLPVELVVEFVLAALCKPGEDIVNEET